MKAIYLSIGNPELAVSNPRTAATERDQNAMELANAVVSGDEQALGYVYRTYRNDVWTFARRLVGESAAADDLVHDVFVRLPRSLRNFRGESSLLTFLIGVAANHAKHFVRAAIRRRAATAKLGENPTRHEREPQDVVQSKQLANALVVALDQLPLNQRVAFILCHVEERSYAEASIAVGVPEGTMRARVFHARQRLQDSLSQWWTVEGGAQ